MNKQIISSTTIILFSFFTISCTYTKLVKVEPGKDYENRKIIGFVKINGEKVDFPKGYAVIIKKNTIQVPGKTIKSYEIKREEIQSVDKQPDKEGLLKIRKIVTQDGKIYYPKGLVEKEDSISFSAFEPIMTPLSDIKMIKIVRTSIAAIFAVILIPIVICLVVIGISFGSGDWDFPLVYRL